MSIWSAILLFLAIPAVMGLAAFIPDLHDPRKSFATSAWIELLIEFAVIMAFVLSLTGVHL